ncbi:MAG: hypothetical protein ACW986_10295 [Promethearchaeota archaeon]
MGSKIFGIISLLAGIASIALIFFFYAMWGLAIPIIAIVFGGIGIAKDDSKALGIIGLILGVISLIIWIIYPILLIGLFLSLLP